jgi:uncharacterized membrane protein
MLVNISVQDNNNIATGNVGTVVANPQFAITGNAATGAVGSIANGARTVALSGVQATGYVSAMIPAVSGVVATGQVGTVVATRTVAITGVSATGAVGTLKANPQPAIIGNSASVTQGDFGMFYWGYIDTNQTPGWQVVNTNNS